MSADIIQFDQCRGIAKSRQAGKRMEQLMKRMDFLSALEIVAKEAAEDDEKFNRRIKKQREAK